jgi:DNA-binding XRE family transcriptional regulator
MGTKLKEARQEARLTQEQLAEKAKVSRSTIVALENNTLADVMASTLVKIAQALGKTVSELFF